MPNDSVHQRFTDALDTLVEEIKQDRSILAVILCGSLSHDTVWEKSDIDLVLVTIDDRKVESNQEHGLAVYADDVNVHAFMISRAEFRKMVEGAVRNSFMHSLLAKGRLLYTHDETIADLCARLHEIGERDTQVQLLRAGLHALAPIYKAHKWLITRGDLDYTALWILYAATPLAYVEVVGAGLLADREVIPQAMKLNPSFFRLIYIDLLNAKKTRPAVQKALDAVDAYMVQWSPRLFAPLVDHLRDVGEARSATEIENHFNRQFDVSGVTTACEYLADQGVFGKAGVPVHLTKRSNVEVQELAFFYLSGPPNAF